MRDKIFAPNKLYSLTVSALRAAAEEQCAEGETIHEVMIIRSCSNAAWMLVRWGEGAGIHVFHGLHTFGDVRPYVDDAGIEISSVPFEPHLLEPLKLLFSKDEHERTFCECGHGFVERMFRNKSLGTILPLNYCPACGYCDGDGDTWEPADEDKE